MSKNELSKYKKPINIDEQIKNLIDLGLEIKDKEYAKKILERITYYRIIKIYSTVLKKNGKYNKNTTFEQIVRLYEFDKELRHIIFYAIEEIEISLRASISNYFLLKYGNFGYRDINNFKNIEYQKKVLEGIDLEIKRNHRSAFIKKFIYNYEGGKVPFYAAMEVSTFGTISKLYKNMLNEDKNIISKIYGVNYIYFESWIENYAYIRNVCAHYGKLYNIKLIKTPKIYKEFSSQGIKNNTLFASIINMKYMLNSDVYEKIIESLVELVEKYSDINILFIEFYDNLKKLFANM